MIKRAPKYRNVKTVVDGVTFDSKAEAKRYCELRLLERAGQISQLARQTPFALFHNGVLITTYRADFTYLDHKTNAQAIEDVKGVKTPDYRIKAKMMAAQGTPITEVQA